MLRSLVGSEMCIRDRTSAYCSPALPGLPPVASRCLPLPPVASRCLPLPPVASRCLPAVQCVLPPVTSAYRGSPRLPVASRSTVSQHMKFPNHSEQKNFVWGRRWYNSFSLSFEKKVFFLFGFVFCPFLLSFVFFSFSGFSWPVVKNYKRKQIK